MTTKCVNSTLGPPFIDLQVSVPEWGSRSLAGSVADLGFDLWVSARVFGGYVDGCLGDMLTWMHSAQRTAILQPQFDCNNTVIEQYNKHGGKHLAKIYHR